MRVSSAVSLAKSVSRMRLRDADRFSEEVCRLATTEVKRFWIAPRSARTLLTDSRALSTIDIAFCAPSAVVTFRSLTKLAAAPVRVPPLVLVSVRPRPARVAAVAPAGGVAALTPRAKVWPSLTEARLTTPALTEATTPVSPSLLLIAAAVAEVIDSPAFTVKSLMVTVVAVPPGGVTETCRPE